MTGDPKCPMCDDAKGYDQCTGRPGCVRAGGVDPKLDTPAIQPTAITIGDARAALDALTPPPAGGADIVERLRLAKVGKTSLSEVLALIDVSHAEIARLRAENERVTAERDAARREANDEIAAMVSRAPEPIRALGEYLSGVLDEDQWPAAERYVLGAQAALDDLRDTLDDKLVIIESDIIDGKTEAASAILDHPHIAPALALLDRVGDAAADDVAAPVEWARKNPEAWAGVRDGKAHVIPIYALSPIQFVGAEGKTLHQMREHVRRSDLSRRGDVCLVWVSAHDLTTHQSLIAYRLDREGGHG